MEGRSGISEQVGGTDLETHWAGLVAAALGLAVGMFGGPAVVELADGPQAELVAKWLGWERYYGKASDWGKHNPRSPHSALETDVISNISIERVIEFDASPDKHDAVFTEEGKLQRLVQEVQLQSAGDGVFGTIAGTDRGTMRVDLENGLSIFALHLKWNRNNECVRVNRRVGSATEAEVMCGKSCEASRRRDSPLRLRSTRKMGRNASA